MASPSPTIDAFLLFNKLEPEARKIAALLEERGVSIRSLHIFYRNNLLGDGYPDITIHLREAATIVALVGNHGWAESDLRYLKQAERLEKPTIPVLLGSQQDEVLIEAGLESYRYVDLRRLDPLSLDALVSEIQERMHPLTRRGSEAVATSESTRIPQGSQKLKPALEVVSDFLEE